ncbi:MAG: prephenate dehydrogenase/arogenate dehydrogenase family protein [Bryobacteraceae bacterium]|nr:prephenate dehydrogenase/arogenate dehydrogenase family protein [Bryobacteraceae bacterium]
MEVVAIVGVGLIGGSFGLALRASNFTGHIIGVSSPRTIDSACERGAIDRGEPLELAVPSADLVYLAQPIQQILDTLPRLAPLLKPGCLVTDAGSTKAAIAARAREVLPADTFIGGHPMAGKEVSGISAADPGLFRGRPYLLTPSDRSLLGGGPGRRFLSLLEGIGARVRVLDAQEHDRLVAQLSHLPQVLSTVLAATLERTAVDPSGIAGPGLTDMTRLALSSHAVWGDILVTNRHEIESVLDTFAQELAAFRLALSTRQTEDFFDRAGNYARRVRSQ